MPRLKEVPLLKKMCLRKVIDNLTYHVNRCRFPMSKEELLLYTNFQKKYSDELLEFFVSDKYYSVCLERLFLEYSRGDEIATLILTFIFNPRLKTLFRLNTAEMKIHPEAVLNLIKNCKEITKIDLRYFPIADQRFTSLVTHTLKNVVEVDFANTVCCDETLTALWRYCDHLTRLNVEQTKVTDQGVKMCCGYYFHSEINGTEPPGSCKIATKCSIRPKLKYLNLDRNRVSNNGLMCILQHFQSLKVLHFRDGKIDKDGSEKYDTSASVPRALMMMQRMTGTPKGKMSLESLTFSTWNDIGLNLSGAISLCPKLREVIMEVASPLPQYSVLNLCKNLDKVKIYIAKESTIESAEFLNFLFERGKHLISFELVGTDLKDNYSLDGFDGNPWHKDCEKDFPVNITASTILKILCFCPNLERLMFHQLHILSLIRETESTYQNVISNFKHYRSMRLLKTFIVSCVTGVKFEVMHLISLILSNCENLQRLSISCSSINDQIFSSPETVNAVYTIRKLTINKCFITHKLLWWLIRRKSELKVLVIANCKLINLQQFHEVKQYIQQHYLDIYLTGKVYPTFVDLV